MNSNIKTNIKKSVAFLATLVFALSGIVASANGSPCTPHLLEIVSDTSNTVVGNGNAVTITPHIAWTAIIPGSTTWIWESPPTTPNEVVGFEKSFTVVGSVLSAQLDIATDNSYKVFIDNVQVAADASAINFTLATQDTYNLTANVIPGAHTLRIEVKNHGTFNSSTNPAGLLYKLTVNSEECCPRPDCCFGDITVTNTNSGTIVTNTVTTVSSTGGNSANGRNASSWNATGGNGGTIITGNARSRNNVSNVVNTNIVRIRR